MFFSEWSGCLGKFWFTTNQIHWTVVVSKYTWMMHGFGISFNWYSNTRSQVWLYASWNRQQMYFLGQKADFVEVTSEDWLRGTKWWKEIIWSKLLWHPFFVVYWINLACEGEGDFHELILSIYKIVLYLSFICLCVMMGYYAYKNV